MGDKDDIPIADWMEKNFGYRSKEAELRAHLLQKRIEELELQVAELQDPAWETYITITKQWLKNYPPDIFTGISGDPGPLFVVDIRKALARLFAAQGGE